MSGLSLIDVWYRRLPRYLFIEDRLQDQSVLELGCGSGLGADFLIEQGAGRVVGVDADERQILKARARYKRPNLSFEVAGGGDLPFADGEFGLVLIPEGSQAIGDGELLAAVRRVLRPDGLCLVAVPNGDLEEPDPDGLSYYDMIESLEPVFPSVTMVAQTPMFAFTFVDFLASAEELDVGLDDSLAQDLVDDVAFYVALCSKEPYSPQVFSITQIPFAPVARRVQHLLDGQPPEQLELAQLQEALAAEREERIRLDDTSGDLERDLLETQNIMRDLRARLALANDQQAAVEARLDPIQAQLDDATRAAGTQRAVAEELERERDGLRDQADRYVKQTEAAEQELEAARREAGELHQRAESHTAEMSELEALRSRADQSERAQEELSARLADEQERVDGLEAECLEAKASLSEAEGEVVSGRVAQEELGKRATRVQRELDEVGGELEQRDRRVAELERDLAEARGAADQGDHRIVELERDLGEVRAAADRGGHRIVELERELGEVRGQAEDGAHQIVELEREQGEASEAVDLQRQRAGELERDLAEANEAVDRQRLRVGELERELDEVRRDAEERGHRVAELERELDEVRSTAEQRKVRTGELKREVELAQTRAQGFQEGIVGLDTALDDLRIQAGQEREQAAIRIEQLQEQIAEAEAALGAAQHQCSGLEGELVAQREETEELGSRLLDTEAAQGDAEARVAGLSEDLVGARQEQADGLRLREEVEEEARRIQEQLEAAQERFAEAQEEQADQSQRLEAMEAGLDSSREEVRTLKNVAQEANQAIADREEELGSAREQVDGLAEQLAQASEKTDAAAKKLERLGQQLLAADDERANQDGQRRELERDLATARADRLSLEVRLEQALIRADQSEVTGAELRVRKEDLESRLIGDLEEARVAQIQTRSDFEQQRAELDQQRTKGSRTEEALTDARSDLDQQRAELDQQRAELDQQRTKGSHTEKELTDARSELKQQRVQGARTEEALTDARSDLEQTRSDLEQQRSDLEQQRTQGARTEEALTDARSDLEQTRSDLEQTRSDLEQTQSDLEQTRSDLGQTQSDLGQQRTQGARTEEELTNARTDLESARAAAREQETFAADKSERLQTSLQEVQAHASSLEERAQGLMVRLTEQESQTHGVQDRLRSVADALVAREVVLEAVQKQLAAEQVDRSAREGLVAEAQQELSALEQALRQERQVREEIEISLDGVESSMSELSTAGEQAVRSLEAARREAAAEAGEAVRWQEQCAEAQRELQLARDHAVALEAASEAVDMDETVGQLRSELKSVRDQGAALGAERARLMRQASLAADDRDAVAVRLAVAEQAYEATGRGMELVIARLESERERADGLDRETRELRARVQERGEFTVRVTREAALEAQRASQYRRDLAEATDQVQALRLELDHRTAELGSAREAAKASAGVDPAAQTASSGVEADLAPVVRRLEDRTTALQAAQATIRELSDQVGSLTAEHQELRRAHATAVQADQGVSDWDAEIQQGKVRRLEADQVALEAKLQERTQAQRELESRLQGQADHVKELLAGAEQHRLEMADREISLAEQAAWNAELLETGQQTSLDLLSAQEGRDQCEASLMEAQREARQLGTKVARLEGEGIRRVAELEAFRQESRQESTEAATTAADTAEIERARDTAIQEAAACAQRLEDRKQIHFEQVDRIEELEALLELAKHAKRRGQTSPKKRETLIGVGPDTVKLPAYNQESQAPAVDLAALRLALNEVSQLEKTCQMEEERIGVLATSLARLGAQAGRLQEQVVSERQKLAEAELQRRDLASQAARLPELELELELLRAQSSAGGGAEQAERAELAERLLLEQTQLGQESAQNNQARITVLNNTIGDKDAEILLLHASMESMQRRARQLAENIEEALRGAVAPSGGSTQALLDRVRAELEGLTRKG